MLVCAVWKEDGFRRSARENFPGEAEMTPLLSVETQVTYTGTNAKQDGRLEEGGSRSRGREYPEQRQ